MRADVIKLLVTGGVMTDGSDVGVLQWAPDELQAAIAQAHQLGRRVAGHCHGAEGVKAAIRPAWTRWSMAPCSMRKPLP